MDKQPNKKAAGRPAKNTVQPIKDTPKRVAQAIMKSPPKKKWGYKNGE